MARLFLLLLLGIGATLCTVVNLHKRIIGGQKCHPKERRYHVKLTTDPAGSSLLCGGSLISKQWILTAAHCFEPTIYAVLGVHPGHGRVVQIIDQAVIFKDKDNNNNYKTHDIMLLKLPSPTKIRPVRLPHCKKRPRIGKKVQVAGFGVTAAGLNNKRIHGTSNTLQCVNIEIVDCQRLQHIVKNSQLGALNYQSWRCYQSQSVDTCPGDSGGGVVYRKRIYGVISIVGDSEYACSEAGGFMDICHEPYLQWIKRTIAGSKKCQWCG